MPQLPFEGAIDKSDLALQDKIALFGDEVIPLIIPYGTKGESAGGPFGRYMDDWQTRTVQDALEPNYQADLLSSIRHNAAMRQGGGLTQLVAFDFDTGDEAIIEEFFTANPKLRKSLFTVGARGFTVWFRIRGPYRQKAVTISIDETHKVEWRGNKYSLFHGRHPKGMNYRLFIFDEDHPIVTLEWQELRCPHARWKHWPPLCEEPKGKAGQRGTGSPLAENILKRRLAWIEEAYGGILWQSDDGLKVRVICPTCAHHGATRDEDTVIFTGADGSTANFHCSHNHCETTNKEQTARLLQAFVELETIVLRDSTLNLALIEEQLAARLGATGKFFRRNEKFPYGLLYWFTNLAEPIPIEADSFNGVMGECEIEFARPKYKGGNLYPAKPNTTEIKEFLKYHGWSALPQVKFIIRTPLLCKTSEGARLLYRTYLEETQSIILGSKEEAEELGGVKSIQEAREILDCLCSVWKWNEKIDQARALGQLLTQALLAGGFIERPIPAFLTMADGFNAGKTFWHKTVGWIYGEEVDSVICNDKQRIGGFEEQINYAIYSGKSFFLIDELEGSIKSALLNALLTGATKKTVRVPYAAFIDAAIDHFVLLLAGITGFSFLDHTASRIMPIRLKKISEEADQGYQWNSPDGKGLMKDWVLDNKARILSAIYRVILEWEALGYPLSAPDGRFPSWNMAVDEILTRILGFPRATEGLDEVQKDLACDVRGWLSDCFAKLAQTHYLYKGDGEKAIALDINQLRRLLLAEGLGIPGLDNSLRGDQERKWDQNDKLRRAIERLSHGQTDESGNMVFKNGSQEKEIIFRIRKGNKKNGKPNFLYLLSTVNNQPQRIETLSEEDDLFSFTAN